MPLMGLRVSQSSWSLSPPFRMCAIKRLRVIALMACVVLSARADPAAPYGHNCLQRIEQWQPVNGKWSAQNGSRWLIERGALRIAGPESDGRILFAEPNVLPRWYSLRLNVSGFSRAKEKAVGIILGYTDAQNYYVCTFSQTDDQRATVSLVRIRGGREESTSTFPFERRAEDSANISVEVYAQGHFRARVQIGNRECLTYQEATTQPSTFGIVLPSGALSVTSCIISGIAKL